ncbi:lysozyme inhibitor LprI family protein [Edwardsiella tarda]|uniref:lysozyme inhibitor LprI family protein n=1 Tax=Edwardsiella tarda TaxID=636 RepID=UPI00083B7797|nr:lysozyme inhibitor LprI family protein [Edwardsiella tarda]
MKKILAAVLCLSAFTANAAGFDCAKASSAIEITICTVPELDKLDEQLNNVYRAAVAVNPELKTTQRAWVKDVRNTTASQADLIAVYKARISEIAQTLILPAGEKKAEPATSEPVAAEAAPETKAPAVETAPLPEPKAKIGSDSFPFVYEPSRYDEYEWLLATLEFFGQRTLTTASGIKTNWSTSEKTDVWFCVRERSSQFVEQVRRLAVKYDKQDEFLAIGYKIESGFRNMIIIDHKEGEINLNCK